MAILIDPPLWPAHGTVWSHLVSDTDYDELHEFAAGLPLPRRGFDLDHYDVPASLYPRAIEHGAISVGSRELVHRLGSSGLRVRHADRAAVRLQRRRQYLLSEWTRLARAVGAPGSDHARENWQRLGANLLGRWNEPHRHYHNEGHLEDVLLALNHLTIKEERLSPATLLAAWFHDAIYTGRGPDKQDSANLAEESLVAFELDPAVVHQVGELIVATTPSFPLAQASVPLAQLLDSDLAIFGASEARYRQYTLAVRHEYAHVSDSDFRQGRAEILSGYLSYPTIYRTPAARELWEERARVNLAREIGELTRNL